MKLTKTPVLKNVVDGESVLSCFTVSVKYSETATLSHRLILFLKTAVPICLGIVQPTLRFWLGIHFQRTMTHLLTRLTLLNSLSSKKSPRVHDVQTEFLLFPNCNNQTFAALFSSAG
jgi:hypothetical protein